MHLRRIRRLGIFSISCRVHRMKAWRRHVHDTSHLSCLPWTQMPISGGFVIILACFHSFSLYRKLSWEQTLLFSDAHLRNDRCSFLCKHPVEERAGVDTAILLNKKNAPPLKDMSDRRKECSYSLSYISSEMGQSPRIIYLFQKSLLSEDRRGRKTEEVRTVTFF